MGPVQYTSRVGGELKDTISSGSCSHLQQRAIEAAAEAVDGCWAEENGVKKVAVVKDFWGVGRSVNGEWWRIDGGLLSMRSEGFCPVEVGRAVIFAAGCEKDKRADTSLVTCQREGADKRDRVVVVRDVIEDLFCRRDYHVECSFLGLQTLDEFRVTS